ncbi:MAG: GNAT family N-acetyltransferase [Paracoccaceae bacterium]
MFDVRATRKSDLAALDALLARSYPILLRPDYPPSVLVTALPIISRAQPALIRSGTYYGVFDQGELVGAGGWTRAAPGGQKDLPKVAHIRHVITDHTRTRQGIGRALMARVLADARKAGVARLACQSTRTAVPFYRAIGFESLGDIQVPLRPGITFPAVKMQMLL